MGVIRSMRHFKLLFLSILFFFGLLTVVGLLFPSTVHISRAIDLPGQKKQDLIQRIEDSNFRQCWLGDTGQILLKNGFHRTDSSLIVSVSDSKQQLGWYFHGKDGVITLQARIDIELGWMPWSGFRVYCWSPGMVLGWKSN